MGSVRSASAPAWASAVVRRLKRRISDSMPRKRGLSRLRRWAKTPFKSEPLHSRPWARDWTEKDISDAAVSTPSDSNRRTRFGYVRWLKTRNPVSTPCVMPSIVTSTVWAWPPNQASASNRVTCEASVRRWAAANPEMPDPMTAIRRVMAVRPSVKDLPRSASGPTREGGRRRRGTPGWRPAWRAGCAAGKSSCRLARLHGAAPATPDESVSRCESSVLLVTGRDSDRGSLSGHELNSHKVTE